MITVTNNNDSGAGSLRQAVIDAAVGEEITFSITGTITLTSGQIQIVQDVTITGPGSANLTIGTLPITNRVFHTLSGVVQITGLTIGPASDSTGGGGLRNETTLTLDDIIITICSATGGTGEGGGAMYNNGTVLISNCSFLSCTTTGEGGAISNIGTIWSTTSGPAPNIIIENCIATLDGGAIYSFGGTVGFQFGHISGCQAGNNGGAIFASGTFSFLDYTFDNNTSLNALGADFYNDFGTFTPVRCTFSNGTGISVFNNFGTFNIQTCTFSGCNDVAVYNSFGNIAIRWSTIVENVLGMIQLSGSVATMQNTILAGNIGSDLETDLADFTSNGNNLFGDLVNPITPGPDDVFGLQLVDLVIGPLQDNGGPTFTHALLATSPALDAGNPTGAPATDQRGEPRTAGVEMDIGAYEATLSCLTFTGTLPGWLTIQGDCLVVTPGSFRASTKAQANADAQAALDAFVAAALASGDLTCS